MKTTIESRIIDVETGLAKLMGEIDVGVLVRRFTGYDEHVHQQSKANHDIEKRLEFLHEAGQKQHVMLESLQTRVQDCVRQLQQQQAQQTRAQTATTTAQDPFRQPGGDPWKGGVGSVAGPNTSAVPPRPETFNMASPLTTPAHVGTGADQKTMYEDKTAMHPATQLGNGFDGYKWRKHTRNYLIGRTRYMFPFLNWIERQTDKIRLDDLQQRLEADPHMPCIDRLAVDLAHGLRSLPNLNLVGDPKRKFEAVEWSNGAEVWRKVVGPLVSRSEERRHFL